MPDPIEDLLPGIDIGQYDLPVQPGISFLEQLINAAVQKYIADLQNRELMNQFEIQLGASPQNFVAQQLYKRKLEEQGYTPITGPAASDQDIQAAYQQALGFTPTGRRAQYNPGEADSVDALKGLQSGNKLLADYMLRVTAGLEPYDQAKAERLASGEGQGRFGVTIPRTGEFSRKNWLDMSDYDKGILASFLSAGTEAPEGTGAYNQIDPQDYINQILKGFIPAGYTGMTQVKV